MRDNHNVNKKTVVVAPITQTNSDTAIVGAIIDNANYDSLEYILMFGAMTDTDMTSVVLLEESDDSGMSGATAVADDDLLGTELGAAVTFANDGVVRSLGYKGSKRYTRITFTPTGNNSGALPIAILALQTAPKRGPITQ